MDYLFSIHPTHVDNIFSGRKSVELRNRRVHIRAPSRLWIYATSPSMSIVGFAQVKEVVAGSPGDIWKRFEEQICVDKDYYWQYIGNRNVATAIVFDEPQILKNPLELPLIRKQVPTFQPPQFYFDLNANPKLSLWLSASLEPTHV